jgi:hypothetical protein
MAFLFVDSFDHYTALPNKNISANNACWIDASAGRFGGGCLVAGTAGTYYTIWPMPAAVTYYVGFAYKQSGAGSNPRTVIGFFSGGTRHCYLSLLASGQLQAIHGGGTVLGSSTNLYPANEWHYIEIKVTIDDSSGVFEVRVDGTNSGWINASGDTRNGALLSMDSLHLPDTVGSGTQTTYYDDLYVDTAQFHGDVRIIYRAPEGAGYYTQWISSTTEKKNADMQDNSTPSPNVVSCSNFTSPYDAWRAWDEDQGNPWYYNSTSAPQWLKYDFGNGNARIITNYDLKSNTNNASYPGMPTAWNLQGSNNDADWDTLDSRSGASAWGNSETRNFTFNNETAYRYYKLNLTTKEGGANGWQLDEIRLYGPINNYTTVDESPPVTTDYVQAIGTDKIDSYAMQDISQSSGTVKAVVGNYYVQKADAGSRTLKMVTRLSSTDLESSEKSIPSSWGFLQFIQETKPGGGAWSVQDTKDAEMGMKLEV